MLPKTPYRKVIETSKGIDLVLTDPFWDNWDFDLRMIDWRNEEYAFKSLRSKPLPQSQRRIWCGWYGVRKPSDPNRSVKYTAYLDDGRSFETERDDDYGFVTGLDEESDTVWEDIVIPEWHKFLALHLEPSTAYSLREDMSWD